MIVSFLNQKGGVGKTTLAIHSSTKSAKSLSSNSVFTIRRMVANQCLTKSANGDMQKAAILQNRIFGRTS